MALSPIKNRAKGTQSTQQRGLRTLRNVAIAMLVLVIVIGAVYLLISWLSKPKIAGNSVVKDTQQSPTMPQPHRPPRDVPIGSSIQSLTTPVAPGGNVSLILRTTESAVCTIKVVHLDEQMREVARVTDGGLVDKTADEFGVVTWTWTMPAGAAQVTWHADITCQRDSKSTRSVGDIVVKG